MVAQDAAIAPFEADLVRQAPGQGPPPGPPQHNQRAFRCICMPSPAPDSDLPLLRRPLARGQLPAAGPSARAIGSPLSRRLRSLSSLSLPTLPRPVPQARRAAEPLGGGCVRCKGWRRGDGAGGSAARCAGGPQRAQRAAGLRYERVHFLRLCPQQACPGCATAAVRPHASAGGRQSMLRPRVPPCGIAGA